jgi:phospholipid/cholesterol/gamma-HCH transport system substrate-binding protein
MNESSNKRIVVVGVFICLGLLFLLAGIMTVGNIRDTFTKKMRLTALFDDVNGLQPGSKIWFSGVKVGTVKKVRFYGESQVEVILNLDKDVKRYIRKDAKAKISTDGLIGNKILVIYGGSFMAAEVEEGDTLGVEKILSTEDIMNTLQKNNENLLAITNDFKGMTAIIASGRGTMGKLLHDETLYNNVLNTTSSLQKASAKAQYAITALSEFTSKLDDEGTLANDLVTDTVLFNSMSLSILKIQEIADTASIFVTNMKNASNDPNSPIGVLMHDEKAGKELRSTFKNLETGSIKLNEDLEALKHNFLLRRYFRKQARKEKKEPDKK